MIHGIGHDVLEIKRISILLSGQLGFKFMERVLTEKERDEARKRGGKLTEFVAGRFAAKEAISKAFGCGIGSIISFGDIEILPDSMGRPVPVLSQGAWERLNLPGEPEYVIHLTISHQTELASAFAVIEKTV
ncbi:holo-ACP synthase [Paenibacillus sp.]|uniref:holo-ACP synthase n=1 Tax=Paenibacillus sp. TaxID=58172 RepID=UPI00281930F5|nr:holo-ACP synthase [Paenibacillus sp.]MDR0268558.1 holo-ACP synthase [Paenibacillus sp.]